MTPHRALIVDDHEELAENISEILQTLTGREIESSIASSGAAAEALAKRIGDEVDLLIIDRRLPDWDGLELVNRLRTLCPNAEAVLITGDAQLEGAVKAVGKDVFAYVLKPFVPTEFLSTVAAALAKVEIVREREGLRRRLEESERRHREVVEAVPAFVLAVDDERKDPALESTSRAGIGTQSRRNDREGRRRDHRERRRSPAAASKWKAPLGPLGARRGAGRRRPADDLRRRNRRYRGASHAPPHASGGAVGGRRHFGGGSRPRGEEILSIRPRFSSRYSSVASSAARPRSSCPSSNPSTTRSYASIVW